MDMDMTIHGSAIKQAIDTQKTKLYGNVYAVILNTGTLERPVYFKTIFLRNHRA